MNPETLDRALAAVRRRWPKVRPFAGLILGSGWGEAVRAFAVRDCMGYEDIPGLGRPGVAGHAGRLAWVESEGQEALIFQGRRHFYEGRGWTPVAIPPYVLQGLGAPRLIITNAAGGLVDTLRPGDLMLIEDHINLMHANPLVGEHNPVWGARFPDQSEVYDLRMRDALLRVADRQGRGPIPRGIYLATSGPAYETPAEVRAYRALGAHAVGMSTVPEAMLAHAGGLRVMALSCITNLAGGLGGNGVSHEEVTRTMQQVMARAAELLGAFWGELVHGEG
jgi:purine-nucleoside phosphorylase